MAAGSPAKTSGRPSYAATRHFYERLGYHTAAVVPNFYGPRDDQVVSVRELSAVSH